MKVSALVEVVTIEARSQGVEETAAATERLARAGDAASVSSEKQAKSTLTNERALERVQRQIDSAYRQTQLFEQAQRTLDRAFNTGKLSAEGYDRAIGLLSAKYGPAASGLNDNSASMGRFQKATGLAGHEVRNLSFQLNDVVSGLASGQSAMMIFAQQGGQVQQILSSAPGGVGGALAGIGRYLIGLVNPATVAAGALLAIGGTALIGLIRFNGETAALEKALTGVGRSTAVTAAGLARMAEAGAAQGKITVSNARDAAAALASTGKIGVENFEGLIAISKRFADTLGVDAAEGNRILASSFADPSKGADDLNAKLNFLTDATRSHIRELLAQNDATGAQRALQEALIPALVNTTANTTLLGRAWQFVASAASGAASAMAAALQGPTPAQALLAARARLEDYSGGNGANTARGKKQIQDQQNDLMVLEEQYRRNGQAAAAASKAMSDEAIANKISVQAGDITRALNPLAGKFDELRSKAATLKTALDNPGKLADPKATADAYEAYNRAANSLIDSQGKLITTTDVLRQKDELAVAAKKATTEAEKASVAERQKSLDLVGEIVTKEEASRRVSHAGAMERIADAKGSGSAAKDAASAYDNLRQRTRDRIEELELEAQYASKTASAVVKLKLAHDLERAAKKDGTTVTEAMRAEWDTLGDSLAAATQKMEAARLAQQQLKDGLRETADSLSSLFKDLATGKGLDAALKSLGARSIDSVIDGLLKGGGTVANAVDADETELGALFGLSPKSEGTTDERDQHLQHADRGACRDGRRGIYFGRNPVQRRAEGTPGRASAHGDIGQGPEHCYAIAC